MDFYIIVQPISNSPNIKCAGSVFAPNSFVCGDNQPIGKILWDSSAKKFIKLSVYHYQNEHMDTDLATPRAGVCGVAVGSLVLLVMVML